MYKCVCEYSYSRSDAEGPGRPVTPAIAWWNAHGSRPTAESTLPRHAALRRLSPAQSPSRRPPNRHRAGTAGEITAILAAARETTVQPIRPVVAVLSGAGSWFSASPRVRIGVYKPTRKDYCLRFKKRFVCTKIVRSGKCPTEKALKRYRLNAFQTLKKIPFKRHPKPFKHQDENYFYTFNNINSSIRCPCESMNEKLFLLSWYYFHSITV